MSAICSLSNYLLRIKLAPKIWKTTDKNSINKLLVSDLYRTSNSIIYGWNQKHLTIYDLSGFKFGLAGNF